VVIFSPPRGGKTGWLAKVILRYPGPVLPPPPKPTSTPSPAPSAPKRGRCTCSTPSTSAASPPPSPGTPLDACEEPAVAIRRADAFATAVTQKGVEDASFWAAKASDYLRGYFHAAALPRLDLRHVARWVAGTALDEQRPTGACRLTAQFGDR